MACLGWIGFESCPTTRFTISSQPADPSNMTIDLVRLLESFVRLRPQLISFSRQRRMDQGLAEDLAQDTWIKLQTSNQPAGVDNPLGFIRKTAQNTTIDYLRKERRRRNIDAEIEEILSEPCDHVSPERLLMGRQTLKAVTDALDQMPDRTRRIFLMSRVEGLTHKRIAEIEAITEEAVYYHVRRALERLAVLRNTLER
ncbi:RNA polymerase sigma factor [Rhizobium sp. RM]|nr:RNA polymerase sigma factor [Rhizobium sp. Td3]